MAMITQDTFSAREVQELVNRLEEVQAAAAASLHVNRHLNLEIEQAIRRVESAEGECQAWRDRATWLSKQLITARKQQARETNGHIDEDTALSTMLEQYESRVNESAGPLTDDTHLSEPLRQRTERLRNTGRAAGWIIDPAEVTLGEVLGQGEFGTTYKAQWRGATVAVKIVKPRSETDYRSFLREIEALAALRHPHVLPFLGACLMGPDKLWLVTEYMAGGSLMQWLHPNKPRPGAVQGDQDSDAHPHSQGGDPFGGAPALSRVSQPPAVHMSSSGAVSSGSGAVPPGRPKSFLERIRMACEVCQGLCALESLNPPLLHRDVKPSNIFVDGGGHARVGDFGLSRRLTPDSMADLTGETGTYLYMAPEVMRHDYYDSKADVWSWGVLLVECMTNQRPYQSTFMTPIQIAQGVGYDDLTPQIPTNVDPELVGIAKLALQQDPQDRMPFSFLSEAMTNTYQKLLNKQNSTGGQTFLGAVSQQLTSTWFSLLGRIYNTGTVQQAAVAAAPQLARTSAPLLQ